MLNFKFRSRISDYPGEYHVRETQALLLNDKKDVTSQGFARQYSKDNDNPAIGQKFALRDALSKTKLSKTDKKTIWNNFFSRSKAASQLKGYSN